MSERRTRGALESAVMRILWDADAPLSAREIQGRFDPTESVPALTTLLTVLDRLRAKHHVDKQPMALGGFVFSAAQSESRYAADAMLSALVGSSDRSAALLRFAGDLSARDVQVLRRALETNGDDARVGAGRSDDDDAQAGDTGAGDADARDVRVGDRRSDDARVGDADAHGGRSVESRGAARSGA